MEDYAYKEGMKTAAALWHTQQDHEHIVSGENLGDNEVNIGLLNTSTVLHKMFAVILWSLFAHIRSRMTSLWVTTVMGVKLHQRTRYVIMTCKKTPNFICVEKKIFIFR